VGYIVKLRQRGAVSGRGSIVGGVGQAMFAFSGTGKVWLEGEAWHAVSKVPVGKDQQVIVHSLDGLTLHVEPLGESAARQEPPTQAQN
jgi:membrane-bound ClpP family serine protease